MVRAVSTLLLLLLLQPWCSQAKEIGPDADWCRAINVLPAGGELVLLPGDYHGACAIRRDGIPAGPIVIRAHNPRQPPRIVYTGTSRNVLDIRSAGVTIRGLQFGPAAVDAIRVYEGHGITIEDCQFSEIGGIAIAATHASVHHLTIRRNTILRSKSTAMYFGCHDGLSCTASDLMVEHNLISGVDSEEGIGYGIQIKLNSTAVIRDNVIVNTKGPGIMIYGARDSSRVSVLERNFVAGSRTSSAIVVGGGPAVVRNNIALTSAQAGIALQDYARWGLLHGIILAHNTLYGNEKSAISLAASSSVDVTIVNNAAHARTPMGLLPAPQPGVFFSGNVDCAMIACFASPGERDFSPHPASPLVGTGRTEAERWLPADDYFGGRRGVPPTVGAVEGPGGRITIGIKPSAPSRTP